MKNLILFALLALTAFAQNKPAAAPAGAPYYKTLKYPPLRAVEIPKVEEFTLPNGIRVKLLENHELPLVSGSVLVRTGGLLEPLDKAGVARITGTLIRTGGTRKMSADELNAKLEAMAASVESSIADENGRVGFSCLKENLDEVIDLFYSVVTEPAFAKDKFDLAITQSRSAISRRNDDSGDIMRREFSNLIYGKETPYGDNEEYATLGAITREDAIQWHDRYYFPANMILSVQGDIDVASVRAKLEKTFGAWEKRREPAPAFPRVTKQRNTGVFVAEKGDSEQTFFQIGHLGGKLSDKDYAVLDVMGDILGGGFSSRLFQKVRSDKSLAYMIYGAWNASYLHEGTFVVGGSTNAKTTEEAIATSLKEIQRMREEMVGPAELEAAKQRVANSFVFNFDSPSKTLSRIISYEYYGYPKDFINQYKDAVQKVTAADILRVAKEYIKPEEFTVVAVGKTAEFAESLKKLNMGEPKKLDISIPEPKKAAAKADAGSLSKGKQALAGIVAAVGGSAKLAGINDYTQIINSELNAGGQKIQVKQSNFWIKPGIFRQENVLPFGKIISFFDGEKGFLKAPQGEQPLTPPIINQLKNQLARDYFSVLRSNDNPGSSVNFVKDGELEIQQASGSAFKLFYNPATNLPQKLSFSEGGMEATYAYEDFKQVDGITVPGKQVVTQGPQSTTQVIVEWKFNTGLTVEKLSVKE